MKKQNSSPESVHAVHIIFAVVYVLIAAACIYMKLIGTGIVTLLISAVTVIIPELIRRDKPVSESVGRLYHSLALLYFSMSAVSFISIAQMYKVYVGIMWGFLWLICGFIRIKNHDKTRLNQ